MFLSDSNTRLTPEGDLEITIKALHQQHLYIRPWDQALEVYVNDIDGQINVFKIDPGIPILSMANRRKAGSDLSKFVSRIPQPIRDAVERLVFNQTLVLQWAARHEAAGDLLVNNPVLLWLLVDAAQKRYWDSAHVVKILSRRQHDVIGELVGTSSKRAVRFLRKLILKESDQREYAHVMWALKQDVVLDATRHFKIFPVQILAMLFYVPELIDEKSIRMIAGSVTTEISIADAFAEASRIYRIQQDTINLGRTIDNGMPLEFVARCRAALDAVVNCSTVQQLERLHEKWTDQLNNSSLIGIDKCFFPAPPQAGSESIVAITNNLDLLKEGREMRHCVGGYSDRVLNGECYVYKVLEPQRATLEVGLGGRHLVIEDLRTRNNGSPTVQCRKSVEQWLYPEREIS